MKKDKKYFMTMGAYTGVLCGAAVMIIAGSLGYRTLADLSLILGLCAGPSIGYILHARYQRAHDEDNGSHQQDKEAMEDQCRQSGGGDIQAKEDKRRQSDGGDKQAKVYQDRME